MECRHGNFWIGLGIGSILGAVAYRLSRTAKARQLESDIYNAIHRIGRDAEIAAAEAERKAMNLGLKAVETGAKVADKVAEEADKAVGKAKEKIWRIRKITYLCSVKKNKSINRSTWNNKKQNNYGNNCIYRRI